LENPYSMKPTIPEIYSKQIVPLTILLVCAIVIWFGGPYVTIASISLHQPERRFYLITVLFLGWLIKFLFFDAIEEQTQPSSLPPDSEKKLQTLHGRFDGALQFLKKTLISKHGKNVTLAQLPWFLMIGTAGSGKTTLLANSGINFILAKQFKIESLKNIAASNHCDWWATRDSVLVDVPGAYLAQKEKPSASGNILWNRLMQLIQKNRKGQPLGGCVITLQLPEIMKKQNQQQKKQIISEIKIAVANLREKFGSHVPFYLLITKCDLLPGFLEYFSDCGSDELTQAWGITIPNLKENEKLHEVFSHRFNALIRRLNKQLIWRLHQERNVNARPAIKDFPLHVERAKESIAHFLKALMAPNLNLQGVYLTSAIQQPQEEQASQMPATINPAAHQALQLARHPSMPIRAYFVRQVILQGLAGTSEPLPPKVISREFWQNRMVYAASIGAILTAAILLGRDFEQSVHQVYSLQNELTQYQMYVQQADPQDSHLSKALPLLDALRTAAIKSNHSLSRFVKVLTFYSHKSQQTASSVYAQALQTIVLPEVQNYLEKYLRSSTEKNPARLYMALKAYLMLGDAQNMQPEFVVSTLKQLIPDTLSPDETNELMQHLSSAFNKSWRPAVLDDNLISQARRELTNLSSTDLAFVILKNMRDNNQDSAISLGTNAGDPPVFVSKQVTNQIPNMFTASAFETILAQDLAAAATETLQGNWILGISPTAPNQTSITALTEQLRTQYIANYVDIWESLLANLQLNTPKNLQQMDAMVANLTSNTSPLLQLLKTIQSNTTFSPVLAMSPKLQSLNVLLSSANNSQQTALYQIFVSLRQLDLYLQNIIHTSDSGVASLESVKSRAQNSPTDPILQLRSLADQSPEPMKSWLNNIATQSWKLILQDAANYVNRAWQLNVAPTYRTQFANHYPFNQNATQEVNLQQFSAFLGQQGTLANFYQSYLKPLVNESDKKWQWKMIDNQKLPFSDLALDQIQQAGKIQRAFFPNGDNTLFVQFALEPLSIDSRTKTFNLSINGQQITYQKQRVPRIVAWPGSANLHSTSINFIEPNDQLVNTVVNGDWGWFRLVTQSTQQVVSTKQLMLTFNLNGHSAKYILFTEGHMNPFLPLNLSRFELPDQLV
jgi:type VI secretion system protein ImpL